MSELVCCADPTIPLLVDILQRQPHVRLYPLPGAELSSQLLRRLECQVLFVRAGTRVDQTLLEGTAVRFVGTPSAGIDHIEVEALRERGITVVHTPGCNANAVAEYVVMALLLWAQHTERSLLGERIGIIGFGNIGRRVAVYARRLGMEVWVYDPPLARQGFQFPAWTVPISSLHSLCSTCSAVTLHVPLTYSGEDATWHLLGAEELTVLPAGALLVQTSRGGVLDEAAAAELLPPKGAFVAIDVWEQEPLINGQLLERALLATPHIAGHSWQARIACSRQLLERFTQWAGLELDRTPFERALAECPPPPSELPWEAPQQLLALLRERRRLEEDTRIVRSWQQLPEPEQWQAFQRFRASYPRRPETLSLPAEPSVPL